MIYLFFAASCIYLAVDAFKKSRNTLNMVVLLLFAVAFTALGLVELMELIAPEWVEVSFWAVVGIMGLLGGASPDFTVLRQTLHAGSGG